MKVQFITTVEVPDELVDENGQVIGTEEYWPPRDWETSRTQNGVEANLDDPRESVEHFAARMLVSYANSSRPGVKASTQIKRGRR